MKKMTLICACAAALSATPALARETTAQSRGDVEHRIGAALSQAATVQQFVADHALMHGEEARGWPCEERGSDAVAKALRETALALAAPAHRNAVSIGRYGPTMPVCDACDDCADCETCADDRCLETIQTRRSSLKLDCVDCPDQASLV
ncbi:hypothetical protein ACFSAG_00140 [Sphingorhabdus buctiana]|uniref:UrcA family protein n=1 Tax=Sphingorhabdus buctiana TaxID=1508805 RepID=A0ABW4MA79_9SPHN